MKSTRDEPYVLDLCDEVLGIIAMRQHRFDFLRGDSGRCLPVDAYYPQLQLVVEYRERQHSERVEFFDHKITVSGVPRGIQRQRYDQLRRRLLPLNGFQLVEIDYTSFRHTAQKRIIRDMAHDRDVVRGLLKGFAVPRPDMGRVKWISGK